MARYLLKLSGEALGGEAGFGIEPEVLERLVEQLGQLLALGAEVAVVLGGGNLFRGQKLADSGMDRVVGDRMGMLATVMNGLAFGDFLSKAGIANKVFCSVAVAGIAAGYNRDDALQTMSQGGVAILSGGTGNPFFTTDTAACLRGAELAVDAVLKATNVDGIYSADPKVDPSATRFDEITYDEILARKLKVMDLTAIILCQENNLPLVVFDMGQAGALVQIANGGTVGTRVIAE